MSASKITLSRDSYGSSFAADCVITRRDEVWTKWKDLEIRWDGDVNLLSVGRDSVQQRWVV